MLREIQFFIHEALEFMEQKCVIHGLDLRQFLRNVREEGDKQQALPKELIMQALQGAISQKPWGHHFEEKPAPFNMNEIGG